MIIAKGQVIPLINAIGCTVFLAPQVLGIQTEEGGGGYPPTRKAYNTWSGPEQLQVSPKAPALNLTGLNAEQSK